MTSTQSPVVGLVGLGAMGTGMAQSLRRAGHAPHVFDVRREVAEAFARDGGTACDSLATLGARCDVVVSVVVNAAQTESVLFGDGSASASASGSGSGSPGCAASMKPGSLFVMCSTVDPNWSVALEKRGSRRSGHHCTSTHRFPAAPPRPRAAR
jgi:putative dehydrogenase